MIMTDDATTFCPHCPPPNAACTPCQAAHTQGADEKWYAPVVYFSAFDHQLTATTRHHPPMVLDVPARKAVQQTLKYALIDWVLLNTNWAKDRDPLRAAAFARYGLFVSRENIIPGSYLTWPLSDLDREFLDAIEPEPDDARLPSHPTMMLNVYEVVSHAWLPQTLADAETRVVQGFIGYWEGTNVRSGQMQHLSQDSLGQVHDESVKTEGVWTEPFEPPDDCEFCQRTTDERVRQRIDAFQWAMDKELASTLSGVNQGYPRDYALPGQEDKRAAFREEQKVWDREHPEGLHAYYLDELPFHLQRTIVTKWNHLWRDWLAEDATYDWQDGALFMLMNRKITPSEIQAPYYPVAASYERVVPYEMLPDVEAMIGASFRLDRDSPPALASSSENEDAYAQMVRMWQEAGGSL